MATPASQPDSAEFAPYYGKYVSLVTAADVLAALSSQIGNTVAALRRCPEHRSRYRYGPGKWSIREVVGHMIDSERIFAYRALRFARGDETPLPGFEQDDFVANGPHDACPLSSLVDEFIAVRQATILMFRNLQPEAWSRAGVASDNRMSVRAAAYVIAGHELHHMSILRDRYGLS
jgi:hypothetical protein